jgi:hypothetical protein
MKLFSYGRYGSFSRVPKSKSMASVPPALRGRDAALPPDRAHSGLLQRLLGWLVGGGTDGNEQLTAMTGLLLIVLLAVLGVTIVRKSQLIWVHLFVGLLLIGPVALKMASTGYRFVRYYTRNAAYRLKGPPLLRMRLIAPVVVLSTLVVFASGVVLLFEGPRHRGPWVSIHKLSFFLWLAVTALHVLGHLPGMPDSLRAARTERDRLDGLPGGEAGRWIALAGMVAGGLALAFVLIPQFAPWTAPGALAHHHH